MHIGKLVHITPRYGFIANEQFERVYMNIPSLVHPDLWEDLRRGQILRFEVRRNQQGFYAVRVAPVGR